MASTSQVRASKGSRPISAHPAFPLVVALWFAALFGLGTLLLPIALFEQVITASGIAAFVPAVAPPLGFTARAGIALAGMVLGAALGFSAARRIAPEAPEKPRRRSLVKQDTGRRMPLNAHEDLGSDGFDSVSGFATARRRALAAQEDLRKSDFFQIAPFPGHRQDHGSRYVEEAGETLDLAECAEFTELQDLEVQDTTAEEEIAMAQNQVLSLVPDEPASGAPLPFSPPSMARVAEPEPEPEPELAEFVAAEPDFSPEPATDSEPGLVQLVQKLGATLEKHRAWAAQRGEQLHAPQFPRAVVTADFGAEFAAPAEAAQAMAAFFAPDADAVTVPTADRDAAPAQSAQLRPFAGLGKLDEPDEDDDLHQLAASFSLPLGRAAVPAPVPQAFAEPEAEGEPEADVEAYPSLLEMKNPFRDNRPEFVRVEEPEPDAGAVQPAVIFPHEASAGATVRQFDRPAGAPAAAFADRPAAASPVLSGEDNDRVLREALLNLQRIGR